MKMKHQLLIYFLFSLYSVQLFAQNIEPLGHGVRTTGEINCFVHDSATGRIYAGGNFENIGGIETNNIAYFDGTLWHAMDSGLVGYVNCMKMMNGNLYVGGSFSRAGNLTIHNVAMWDGNNWHDMGNSVPTTYSVMSLEVFQNELYLSAFLAMGVGAAGVVKWNGAGWITVASTAGSSMPNGIINLYSTDDSLFLYGVFNKINNVTCSNMVAYDGTNFYNYNFTNYVETMIYHHGVLYAANSDYYFHRVGTSWQIDAPSSENSSYLFTYNDSLFATFDNDNNGNFFSIEIWNFNDGFKNNQIASTKCSNFQDWDIKIGASVEVNQKLYFGGVFFNLNNKSIVSSASYNGTELNQFAGAATSWLSAWVNAYISSLVKDPVSGDIYAGGNFLFAGDSIAHNVARWDGSQWHPLGKGFSSVVKDLLFFQNTLYACGAFIRSGSDTVNCVAKWNGTDWISIGTGADNTLYDMEVFNNELYICGDFDQFNGINTKGIIKFNGTNWSSVGTTVLDNNGIRKIGIFNNQLIVIANNVFWFGFNTTNIAKLNGTTWVAMPNIPGGTYQAADLRVFAGELYVSGAQEIYKFTGTAWSPTGTTSISSNLDYGNLFEINGTLAATTDYGMITYNGNWNPFLLYAINVMDLIQLNSTDFLLGGFFPDYFDNTQIKYLRGAAILHLIKPEATILYNDTSICNHQDIFFSTPLSAFSDATYQWMFPGGIPSISSLQSPIVRYNTPGNYSVLLISNNIYGSDTLFLQNKINVYFCAAGYEQKRVEESFLIYPNPSDGIIHIFSDTEIESLLVLNYQGQSIEQFSGININQIDIDMNKYVPGLYFVKLQSKGKWYTEKFIYK